MEVRSVPAREGVIDGVGQLGERIGSGRREDPPRAGQQVSPRPSASSTRIESHARAIALRMRHGIPVSLQVAGDVIMLTANAK
jgi:hypothetical protein